MKNYKGNMLLIELVIVILFFSLSQVVLVQVFAEAQRKTVNSEKVNDALLQVQDIAEQLCDEANPDSLLQKMGFAGQDGHYIFANADGLDLFASVSRLSQPSGQLVTVELSVNKGKDRLFVLPSVQYFPAEVKHE